MELKIDKSNWKKVQFGDVVQKVTNKVDPEIYHSDVIIQGGHINKRDFHIREYENKNELGYLGPAFHMGFKKGQILYVSRNPHLMKVGYPHFDGICANTTYIMETKDEEVLRNELIPFIMHSDTFIEQSVANVRGGVNPYVNWCDLACIEFLLPPKDQQAQLAKLLWAMDDLIEKEVQLLDSLILNLKVNEKEIFDSKTFCKLKTVILNTLSGGTPNTKIQEFYSKGTIPWLTTKIIEDDYIDFGEKLITNDAVLNSAAKVLPKNNVIAGTRVGVGKFAINLCDISFSQDVTGLTIDHSKVNIDFLIYQLNSIIFQNKIEPFLRGTTIKGILKDDLLNMKIYLPSMEVQLKLKHLLKSIKSSRDITKSKISSSKALQKSLINQVF